MTTHDDLAKQAQTYLDEVGEFPADPEEAELIRRLAARIQELEAQVIAASDATALRGFGANKRMRELETQVAALATLRQALSRDKMLSKHPTLPIA